MFAYVLLAAAALAAGQPIRPTIPAAFSANMNLTVSSSEGVVWNFYAGYFAPGKVRLWFARFLRRYRIAVNLKDSAFNYVYLCALLLLLLVLLLACALQNTPPIVWDRICCCPFRCHPV